MACVRGRLCGVRTATCLTGPPAFLAVRTVACVGALRWPRWWGPPPRLALRRQLPAASAGDRGSAVALRTWGVRARAASTGGCARLPTWPPADSPLMRIRWEDRTVGESAPSGRRGEEVEETGCKRKSNVVINHRCRGHKSFSDFDSWGQRSQLPLRGQAGAGRLLEGSRRAAAAVAMAATR